MNNFATALQTMRPDLLRLAQLQLRHETLAEDVVSETIVAALEKETSFAGKSHFKTWVIGILKHKIIDCLRAQCKQNKLLVSVDDQEDIEGLIFQNDGHFAQTPADWGNPDRSFEQTRFFDILELCMTALPPAQGRVFLMKEWFEFSAAEICSTLELSTSNVNVMLHRARLRLRECLELRWFGEQT